MAITGAQGDNGDAISIEPNKVELTSESNTMTIGSGRIHVDTEDDGITDITGGTITADSFVVRDSNSPLYTEAEVKSMITTAINTVLAELHPGNIIKNVNGTWTILQSSGPTT